ncbi:hypothetical protein [Roseibium sp.]|uniref:hypothetical protein n=1 Tax=Roseibium sp. TaxID=1936156 RepID=UPI003B52AC63
MASCTTRSDQGSIIDGSAQPGPARIPPGSSRSLAFSPHIKNAAPETEVETLH